MGAREDKDDEHIEDNEAIGQMTFLNLHRANLHHEVGGPRQNSIPQAREHTYEHQELRVHNDSDQGKEHQADEIVRRKVFDICRNPRRDLLHFWN
mmetsp:Transcript_113393/g.177230  ORF Transcript_113393/g.177230 Transcript_113393/m.177230 type:complete len:95 (-) Transcript_113393:105-389(-)